MYNIYGLCYKLTNVKKFIKNWKILNFLGVFLFSIYSFHFDIDFFLLVHFIQYFSSCFHLNKIFQLCVYWSNKICKVYNSFTFSKLLMEIIPDNFWDLLTNNRDSLLW